MVCAQDPIFVVGCVYGAVVVLLSTVVLILVLRYVTAEKLRRDSKNRVTTPSGIFSTPKSGEMGRKGDDPSFSTSVKDYQVRW